MSIPGSLVPLFNSGGNTYRISRSLRLNPTDSANLSRTPSVGGNRKTWTWSGWIKRTNNSTFQMVFEASQSDNVNQIFFYFVGDGLRLFQNDGSGTTQFSVGTNPIFRDFSAWYHIVVKFDSTQSVSTDRLRTYVNGVDVTTLTDTFPSLNYDSSINSTFTHRIGTRAAAIQYLGAYLADIHLIDGQALTPSSFAETNVITGQWVPKAYVGSYGTNGYQLKFEDNSATTSTTLGKDTSGNGNNWTPNNFSISAGINNDSFVDSPSSYGVDTGLGGEVRGNYPILNLNSIRRTPNIQNGALFLNGGSSNDSGATATMALPTTGKWYWDFTLGAPISNVYLCYSGLLSKENFPGGNFVNVPGALLYPRNSVVCFYDNTGAASCIGETASAGDVYGIAYNADTGLVDFYKNGVKYSGYSVTVTQGITYYPCLFHGNVDTYAHINFGQRPFAYPAPSGYKCLCDTNLPAPTITKPSTVMDVKLYTGNGSTQTISGLGFSPDLVWVKKRNTSSNHYLSDTVRGTTKALLSDATDAEYTNANYITAFNSDGFSVGSDSGYNTSSHTYAAWTWDAGSSTVTNTQGSITSQVRANASAGFSIVTYTGNGTVGATVGHGLGVAPAMLIVKRRDAASAARWAVQHTSLTAAQLLALNTTAAVHTEGAGAGSTFNVTKAGSSVFTLGDYGDSNANTGTYVAYCFAPVAGYSSFGSYTGNGSTDGPFVYTGFRPRWVMIKRSDAVGSWGVLDTARNTFNVSDKLLWANLSDAEGTYTILDILSNGFKLRESTNGYNTSSGTYIYAAFAENPFQYSRAR